MSKFNIGDIVHFGGMQGVVTAVEQPQMIMSEYPLEVLFETADSSKVQYFTLDGKFDKSCTTPLLSLVKQVLQ